MVFQPKVNQQLSIDGVSYRIAPHPQALDTPFGQEGRAAVVYQLIAESQPAALKVFKPRFRLPFLVSLAERLLPFTDLEGLQVCRRKVITSRRHMSLLKEHPDLIYS